MVVGIIYGWKKVFCQSGPYIMMTLTIMRR